MTILRAKRASLASKGYFPYSIAYRMTPQLQMSAFCRRATPEGAQTCQSMSLHRGHSAEHGTATAFCPMHSTAHEATLAMRLATNAVMQ